MNPPAPSRGRWRGPRARGVPPVARQESGPPTRRRSPPRVPFPPGGAGGGELAEALGAGVAREHVVHRDPVGGDLVRHRAGEPRDAGAQRVRQNEPLDRLLHRDRGHVHDAAPALLLHAGKHEPVSSMTLSRRPSYALRQVARSWASKRPGRGAAGVRHQNVDAPEGLPGRLRRPPHGPSGGEVSDDRVESGVRGAGAVASPAPHPGSGLLNAPGSCRPAPRASRSREREQMTTRAPSPGVRWRWRGRGRSSIRRPGRGVPRDRASFHRLRGTVGLRLGGGGMEVGVGAVEPVGAGGREDIHVQRVLERRRLVREMRGDVEDLAGPDRDLAVQISRPAGSGGRRSRCR
jgi:hypothetical protein